jgi:hypothetical protein
MNVLRHFFPLLLDIPIIILITLDLRYASKQRFRGLTDAVSAKCATGFTETVQWLLEIGMAIMRVGC